MANPSHATLVDAQFGARAAAYVTSAVHAQGPDLERLSAIMRGRNDWRVLDLGCGGGHAAFAAAPHVAAVVAYDLSAEMLAAVSAEAARGVTYLGSQGDIWDAQKDMAAALYGALLSMTLLLIVRALRGVETTLESEAAFSE